MICFNFDFKEYCFLKNNSIENKIEAIKNTIDQNKKLLKLTLVYEPSSILYI